MTNLVTQGDTLHLYVTAGCDNCTAYLKALRPTSNSPSCWHITHNHLLCHLRYFTKGSIVRISTNVNIILYKPLKQSIDLPSFKCYTKKNQLLSAICWERRPLSMNTTTSANRNIGIDVLKYLCAFLVICLHTSFRGKTTVDTLARVAVPLFFMITGYYYTKVGEQKKGHLQLKRIFILTIFSNLCFFLLDIVTALLSSGDLSSVLTPWADRNAVLKFIIFNERPGWSHLWYLGALLYALVLFTFLLKIKKTAKVYIFIPILLCTNLILGNYSTLIFGHPLPISFSRNFLCMGLPFLLLGNFIYQYQDKIKLGNKTLFINLLLSVFTTQIERLTLVHLGAYNNKDFFISTIFFATTLFLLVKNNPVWFHSRVFTKIGTLGKNLSLYIYILHPIIILAFTALLEYVGKYFPIVHTIYFYTSPIVILFLSTITGWVLWYFIQKLKKHP